MCNGANGKPCQTSLIEENEYGRQEELHHKISDLLEFSAKDDVMAFTDAVEKDDHDVDEVGLWYGRRVGSKEMAYEERTPLMVAALFGSKGVLSYILGTGCVDVNRVCGSDKATALHCAVSGCSAASAEVINLLLDASADVSLVDMNGNWCSDLIVSASNSIFCSRKRIQLERVDDNDFLKKLGFQMVEQQQDVGTPGTEKKDYLIDPSLPDITNGIYSTDEFRMFTFKVKPCSRAYSHDWTECPFVHKPEELRPLYASTGSALPSPTSYSNSPSSSSMDSFTLSSPSSLIESAPAPPLTPSAASSPAAGNIWQTQVQLHAAVPTLQMPRNRLKTAQNTIDNTECIEFENHLMRKLLMEEMTCLSSPSNKLAGVNPTNLENIFGSLIQSPTSMQSYQNADQQLWGYLNRSAQFRVDAFSTHSQSFVECSSIASFDSQLPSATTVAMEPSTLSGWGSPDGKLDWSIRGDELNKMRKSYFFSFRNRSSTSTMAFASNIDDPDIFLRQESWVNSLVKHPPCLQQ